MALRHFFLLLLPFALFSASTDYRGCQLKYQVSSINLADTQAFSIDKEYALFYSKERPKQTIIKRDPFLGLNLIKSSKPFRHQFKFYKQRPKKIASVLPQKVTEGKILSEQIGLNKLAHFSKNIQKNSLICGTCCGIVGLSTPNGIIEKEYIKHFLQSKQTIYSDIGIRLANKKGARVVEVNPFFKDLQFIKGDVILFMDGKKVYSAGKLSRDILFSKVGKIHEFVVLRDGKKIKLKAKARKRISGGLIPEGFLDYFGIELYKNLFVKKDVAKYAIKKGDRLIYVMGKKVKTLKDIRQILSSKNNSKNHSITLLIKREDFDFFIHIPRS